MIPRRTILLPTLVVTAACCSTGTAFAASPYDKTALRTTYYAVVTLENAMENPSVAASLHAQYALVYASVAEDVAWYAVMNANRDAWQAAAAYHEIASHFADQAYRETGNIDLWWGSEYCFQAAGWCEFAYLYFE